MKSVEDKISKILEENSFPFSIIEDVVPIDNSTLFVCSGMQNLKPLFDKKDKRFNLSTMQTCIRTNDIDLIGDGTHLTSFKMIGNFSFSNPDYETSCNIWKQILNELNITNYKVHIHPESNFEKYWKEKEIVIDKECLWSDGNIGGFCSEIYVNGLEIGNLVNPLKHSTDVGFGLERIYSVIENKQRVDETSLFDTSLDYILRDHVRTIECLYKNNICPSNKGQGYITRRLLRRIIPNITNKSFIFDEWTENESKMRNDIINKAKRLLKRHKDKDSSWWWQSIGILPDELDFIKKI